jgi:hypothetical protein
MLDAPRQNWNLLEERLQLENSQWLRSLSVDDKMTILESLNRVSAQLSDALPESSRLQERRWLEKLGIREKTRAAFKQWDQLDEPRALRTNTG